MFGFFKRKRHGSFSPEVQLIWTEFEKFRIRFRGKGPSLEIALDLVGRDIFRQLSRDGTFATDFVLSRGWSVADATHMMIAELVSAEILTEQMHSSRGVLNEKGKAYLQLFKICTERMIRTGRIPAQQGYAEVRAFEEEIARLG